MKSPKILNPAFSPTFVSICSLTSHLLRLLPSPASTTSNPHRLFKSAQRKLGLFLIGGYGMEEFGENNDEEEEQEKRKDVGLTTETSCIETTPAKSHFVTIIFKFVLTDIVVIVDSFSISSISRCFLIIILTNFQFLREEPRIYKPKV
ncbi:unnamed protein product [Lactuca saligna]|uniref:Uncharacterized protein n=1 Tax=Lactuca saligna TaxID=75948 RepID=A0AA35Z846_LACSI|nr:unnamed protein product [Lactuca saligna]